MRAILAGADALEAGEGCVFRYKFSPAFEVFEANSLPHLDQLNLPKV